MDSSTMNNAIRAAWPGTAATEWLREIQASALDDFERAGFPSRRQENWKYTDVRAVAEAYPEFLRAPAEKPGTAPANALELPDSIRISLTDGVIDADRAALDALPAGVRFGTVESLPAEDGDRVRARYGTLARTSDSPFVALNTAFAAQSLVLLIDDDTVLERPLYLVHATSAPRSSSHPRLLVDLGARARATVIEHHCGAHAAIVTPVTELFCAAGAHLHYTKLQEEHHEAWHVASQYARLEAGSTVTTTHVDAGGAIARNDLRIVLAGSGAHAEATGLFMADARRHTESRVTVDHIAPATTSRERFRGILGGRARGVFNGRIFVDREAQKTDAALSNRNLLLSAGAEINTKPELEIYADDVKCAHGSTTGQLDATAMFYLLSRGIDPATARQMLITAFAAELVADIELPGIAERVLDNLAAVRSDHEGKG